jgi:hypothetical protein
MLFIIFFSKFLTMSDWRRLRPAANNTPKHFFTGSDRGPAVCRSTMEIRFRWFRRILKQPRSTGHTDEKIPETAVAVCAKNKMGFFF